MLLFTPNSKRSDFVTIWPVMICFLFISFLGYMILYIATWANLPSFAKT